jgi:hypothetical protein
VWVVLEELGHCALQYAHAVAVYDADSVDGSQRRGIEELVHLLEGWPVGSRLVVSDPPDATTVVRAGGAAT